MNQVLRGNLYANFTRYFVDHNPSRKAIPNSEIAELATQLPSQLPASYVQFMTQHGPVFCPTILRLCIVNNLEYPDLRQFLTPKQVLLKSRELWAQYFPDDLFVFATDCMGNPFCFRQSKEFQDDASIFFFSPMHEIPVTLKSFDGMLRWYVEHARQIAIPLKSSSFEMSPQPAGTG